jgi:hypothetical protein
MEPQTQGEEGVVEIEMEVEVHRTVLQLNTSIPHLVPGLQWIFTPIPALSSPNKNPAASGGVSRAPMVRHGCRQAACAVAMYAVAT